MSRRKQRREQYEQSDTDRVRNLYRAGLRDPEIAERLGLSTSWVRKLRRKGGREQREAELWGAA